MKIEWLDEATEAIVAAKSLPRFPGEPSPVRALLDKLVEKLWGECHEGKEIGTGECPVCRAYRTEKAEKGRAEAETNLVGVQANLKAAQLKANQLEDQIKDVVEALQFAIVERDAANQALEDLSDEKERLEKAVADINAERGALQGHLNKTVGDNFDLTKENQTIKVKLEQATALAKELLS